MGRRNSPQPPCPRSQPQPLSLRHRSRYWECRLRTKARSPQAIAINRASGPSEEQLLTGRSRLWGEVRNAAGERRTAKLETANGYRLTADGTIMAGPKLVAKDPPGGG